jgi:hypothetical protein
VFHFNLLVREYALLGTDVIAKTTVTETSDIEALLLLEECLGALALTEWEGARGYLFSGRF